ncbi:MAG: hypothetical protein Q4G04_02205 [bacterium]|nr:hypothetical protein [bacterium]
MKRYCDVKSIVIIILTLAIMIVTVFEIQVNKELLMVICTSYGSIITYLFTKKDIDTQNKDKGGK